MHANPDYQNSLKPGQSVGMMLTYTSPMMLTVKSHRGRGIRPLARKKDVYPGRTDAWFFDRLLKEMHLTIGPFQGRASNGQTPSRCIYTREVVQVKLTVVVTITQVRQYVTAICSGLFVSLHLRACASLYTAKCRMLYNHAIMTMLIHYEHAVLR